MLEIAEAAEEAWLRAEGVREFAVSRAKKLGPECVDPTVRPGVIGYDLEIAGGA